MKERVAALVLFIFAFLISVQSSVFAQIEGTNSARAETITNTKHSSTHKIIKLGRKKDPKSGKMVEGIAIVELEEKTENHQQQDQIFQELQSQPVSVNGSTDCYRHTSAITRWKSAEPWIMNATNIGGLNPNELFASFNSSVSNWEDAADSALDGQISKDIIGFGTLTTQPLPGTFNGQNEVYFGNPNFPGAVAITTVWGFFSEPPQGREIVEWDMVLDGANYDWATGGDVNKFDFANITTHELGHVVGLDHPDSACAETTMYASTIPGETKKSSLDSQDITGIWQLYIDAQTDSDTDGFADYKEQYMGTNPFTACGVMAWPSDMNNDKRVNVADQGLLASHFGAFGTQKYAQRFDINADGTINSADMGINASFFGKRCTV